MIAVTAQLDGRSQRRTRITAATSDTCTIRSHSRLATSSDSNPRGAPRKAKARGAKLAGLPSAAGGLRASLHRAAARLTTPFGFLSVLGGIQVLLLWVLRVRFGTWLALAATTGLIALLGLLAVTEHHWRLKLWGITLLG